MTVNIAAIADKLEEKPLLTEKCQNCKECAPEDGPFAGTCQIFRSPAHEAKKEGGCRCYKKEPHAEKLL